jgi:hypothetical protein
MRPQPQAVNHARPQSAGLCHAIAIADLEPTRCLRLASLVTYLTPGVHGSGIARRRAPAVSVAKPIAGFKALP